MQVQGLDFAALQGSLLQDPVFGPFQGIAQFAEDHQGFFLLDQADLVEILLHVPAARQTPRNIAEDQAGITLRQGVLDLIQHMSSGNVHGLNPAHVQDDVFPGFKVRFQRGIELIRGAEKKAALQFEDRRLITLGSQYLHFLFHPDLPRKNLVAIGLAMDHASSDLFSDEQENGEDDTCARCSDQADSKRRDDNRRDDGEIEDGRPVFQVMQGIAIHHAETDHDKNTG